MTDKKEVSTKKVEETQNKNPIVSKDKLLEAGAYFGHKASLWNPKMKDYLYPQQKRGIHIINTSVTIQRLEFAYNLLYKFVSKNPRAQFIFVGTKKQAKDTIKENALRTNSFYVTDRWLGGTLTNSSTIFSRVRTMEELEEKAQNGFEGYVKKEKLMFQKQLDKLHKNLNGIRKMRGLPTFMIVADPNEDEIAVKEARKKGVKVIGILDSNSNPDAVDFGIPANDDSAKSINLIITILADAIATARGGKAKYAYRSDSEVELPKFEPETKNFTRKPSNRKPFVKRNNEEVETQTNEEEKGE
ncbi:30S ribosomal protein S2 [Mycoplasma sp. ES3157-GEN-MYC]|uniref:Small ribosomal subunit protein uS2 n=1 Tax=Mycoplasma miroungigenitalium TaxID=754515 RepID=A0A6M4JEV0_9MOLU|nr:30S ribosomal protein S2 [Mycoplasma miroungigenitalium]MBU4690103.1 30S ribosomal protein S2 [Mycoplasma miroungigenitalium]MBU4691375.1 30S ribosomal protein S2 [Mycoplasma miroungigenitalium]QJR43211.1 30S ribosomal protein S2 [Mycoplasma miroungigenitalium]